MKVLQHGNKTHKVEITLAVDDYPFSSTAWFDVPGHYITDEMADWLEDIMEKFEHDLEHQDEDRAKYEEEFHRLVKEAEVSLREK